MSKRHERGIIQWGLVTHPKLTMLRSQKYMHTFPTSGNTTNTSVSNERVFRACGETKGSYEDSMSERGGGSRSGQLRPRVDHPGLRVGWHTPPLKFQASSPLHPNQACRLDGLGKEPIASVTVHDRFLRPYPQRTLRATLSVHVIEPSPP